MSKKRIHRVAFIGAFDPHYPRCEILMDGLRRQGIEVILRQQTIHARMLSRIWHSLKTSLLLRNIDVVIIPAFNRITAPFTWAINRFLGRIVICDYLVGLKDTAIDRGFTSRPTLKSKFSDWIEKFILTRMNTFSDTAEHIAYFTQIHSTRPHAMHVLPVGTRQVFLDATLLLDTPSVPLIVQYLGSYIPFHGLEIILQAAHLLQNEALHFELIGMGQTLEEMKQLARELDLQNVTFIEQYLKPPHLLDHLKRAAIFLGVFGSSAKTDYVVPTKIYEMMPLGRPIISADSPSIRSHFQPGQHLLTVPPGDPQALAEAVRHLAASPDLRKRFAEQARAHILRDYSPDKIGKDLLNILEGIRFAEDPKH